MNDLLEQVLECSRHNFGRSDAAKVDASQEQSEIDSHGDVFESHTSQSVSFVPAGPTRACDTAAAKA